MSFVITRVVCHVLSNIPALTAAQGRQRMITRLPDVQALQRMPWLMTSDDQSDAVCEWVDVTSAGGLMIILKALADS